MDIIDPQESIRELEELTEQYHNGFDSESSNMEVSLSDSPPRYRDSYLRFSMLSFHVDKVSEGTANYRKEKGLVVVPGGGVMLTSEEKYLHVEQPNTILTSKSDLDLLILLAWMKSSFFLWYCSAILGEIDLFKLLLVGQRRKFPFPKKEFYGDRNMRGIVQNILLEEKKYLKEAIRLVGDEKKDDLNKLTRDHNKRVDSYCRGIDIETFKYIGARYSEKGVSP